jgi:SAM-dependent methyltransferase
VNAELMAVNAASRTTGWAAALPTMAGRLAAGGLVAAVGCGPSAAANSLARAFPQASIYGYDFRERSVQVARQRAAEAGLGGRIRFEPLGATTYPVHGFDLICLLDALHDLGGPAAALAHARNALAPGGAVLVVEPAADDDAASRLAVFGYPASTFPGAPGAPGQSGGVALGVQAGPAAVRQLARDAGFSGFRIAARTPVDVILELRP